MPYIVPCNITLVMNNLNFCAFKFDFNFQWTKYDDVVLVVNIFSRCMWKTNQIAADCDWTFNGFRAVLTENVHRVCKNI